MTGKNSDQLREFGDNGAATDGGGRPLVEFDPNAPPVDRAQSAFVQDLGDTADTVAIGDDWLEAQVELERQLGGTQAFVAAAASSTDDYNHGAQNLPVGTAIGFRMENGLLTPEVALKVLVKERASDGASVRPLSADAPTEVRGKRVEIEMVGDLVASMYTRRYERPVNCGVSIGHATITAGTLGCLVRHNPTNKLCILTNNHVAAASNSAKPGDVIAQPGAADNGRFPQDQVGILEKFIPIRFDTVNDIDAALVWTAYRYIQNRHVTFKLAGPAVAARLGMTVKKNGRTTQATLGTVTDVSANIRVGYPGGVAEFRNQIGIRGVGGVFSRGGDSGSVIVTASSNQPVALLFAGARDNSITFANPMAAVIQLLDIGFL